MHPFFTDSFLTGALLDGNAKRLIRQQRPNQQIPQRSQVAEIWRYSCTEQQMAEIDEQDGNDNAGRCASGGNHSGGNELGRSGI
ncbi:hypothetical protein D3C75_1280930 [compost metagenome]